MNEKEQEFDMGIVSESHGDLVRVPMCDADDSQSAPDEPCAIQAFRWDYAEQLRADGRKSKKTRHSGVLTFAIVMSVCFLITLGVLFASLAFDGFDLGGLISSGSGDVTDGTPSDGQAQAGDALSLQQISAQGKQVVVAVSVSSSYGKGTGTGIVLTSDGYIATNAHVVQGANTITVQMYDGAKYQAELVGVSKIDDLAILKIDAQHLTAAKLGNSDEVQEGDRAVVIGHPAGLEFGWTSTYGFVSAINRGVKIRNSDGTLAKKMTLIQTDANVNSGNSGGPMFNDRGEVIGIITLKLAGDYEGMGFAIPINAALPLLQALMETGTTDGVVSEVASARAVLGITGVTVEKDHYYLLSKSYIYTLTQEQAEATDGSFMAQASGVLITGVSQTSHAVGKLEIGDVIVALNGNVLGTMDEMMEYLNDCYVGDTVEVELVRDGQTMKTEVILIAAEQ